MLADHFRGRGILRASARDKHQRNDNEGLHPEMLVSAVRFAREEQRTRRLVANHSETRLQ
jgi:hypothetical protein